MSRVPSKSRNRTAPRNSSPAKDPKFLLIRQRINQIASSMRSPLKPNSHSLTPDPSNKENSIKSPINKARKQQNTLEEFLIMNQLENYIEIFKENQIGIQDIPHLTKDDLIDLKLPMGPRKRLLSIIEDLNSKSDDYESSPKRFGLKEEVNKFMNELSQFSKRSEPKFRPTSRNLSLETSFDAGTDTQRMRDSIGLMIREINDKQNFMIKAIEENQRAIIILRQQFNNTRKKKCSCSEYR